MRNVRTNVAYTVQMKHKRILRGVVARLVKKPRPRAWRKHCKKHQRANCANCPPPPIFSTFDSFILLYLFPFVVYGQSGKAMPFLQFESSIAKPLVKRKHGFGALRSRCPGATPNETGGTHTRPALVAGLPPSCLCCYLTIIMRPSGAGAHVIRTLPRSSV